ncbi:MBL fold metallo-hydrolase [Thermoplasmatales archaeon AK]|nr:MBL fold metallo-hydrolase [Thermoplasmatales archaeon AK]
MDWERNLKIVKTGSFSLDPGAYFGIVPRGIWQKSFNELESRRIRLSLTTAVINNSGRAYVIDTGISGHFDEKLSRIYEVFSLGNAASLIGEAIEPGSETLVVCSHLHFDHSGNCAEIVRSQHARRGAIVQEIEWRASKKLNEFTRGSYVTECGGLSRRSIFTVRGTTRVGDLSLIFTGGHSPGHQVVAFRPGHGEILYLGDLMPSRFHAKPAYITAIDVEPLVSVKMKRLLLKRAIRNGSLCIFNHDDANPAGFVRGDPDRPVIETVI